MAQPIWNTAAGSVGSFPASILLSIQLNATAQPPAISVIYTLLSGNLPTGLRINAAGLIYGTPDLQTNATVSTFTVRATDNLGNLRDRTFSMSISGASIPQFTTPAGNLLSTQDSYWVRLPIGYSNPDPSNIAYVELKEGMLPPGLEINELGIIQGYPQPPIVSITLPLLNTVASATTSTTNIITCSSTVGFTIGRPVIFTGTVFGDIVAGTTYYIKTINTTTSFTVSATQNGSMINLVNATGYMTVSLPDTAVGAPTIRTYTFTLVLVSVMGGDTVVYSMTIINQNTPVSQGGPGKTPNSRIPTLLNTRPLTYRLTDTDSYFGYYILPPVEPTESAFMGTAISGDYFAFKMIGYDFDNNPTQYSFSGLPLGLVGDPVTGWITGTPVLTSEGISNYNFRVSVYKVSNPGLTSGYFNYSLNISNNVLGYITWVSPANLGTVYNGTISTLSVSATSDVALSYRISTGSLPPNLELLTNGEIIGRVADQPTSSFLQQGAVTPFTFTVLAYSADFSIIYSSKTFTIDVLQQYSQPTDVLYIKASPSVNDRQILATLLTDTAIIPTDDLYRPADIYFGKASSIVYDHAYGIYASEIATYLAAVTENHYWRNITLGELKTAVAKNEAGDIIYEVVYSEVIDNLVNPYGVSIKSPIYWNRPIDLGLGPWYTSITDIYTSYDFEINGLPTYYTSLSPGYARVLYPASLYNMRNRVAAIVGQEYDSNLLPSWMTSQQPNGSTLGYTQAWVICYTKPGKAAVIKNNIKTMWQYSLNQINVNIDRFTVDKSTTYDYDNKLSPPAWIDLPSGQPVPDPLDGEDFYVLFPRKTILPDQTQY